MTLGPYQLPGVAPGPSARVVSRLKIALISVSILCSLLLTLVGIAVYQTVHQPADYSNWQYVHTDMTHAQCQGFGAWNERGGFSGVPECVIFPPPWRPPGPGQPGY
jgi:hypothetical protein